MLSKDQFDEWFLKLELNFNRTVPTGTKDFFYQENLHLSFYEWGNVCQGIIDHEEFFPKKVTFVTYLNKLGKKRRVQEDCYFCDGWGWAYTRERSFRAECKHGDELSKAIPTHNLAKSKVPTLETDLDRQKLVRGIEWLERVGYTVPEFIRKKVELPF